MPAVIEHDHADENFDICTGGGDLICMPAITLHVAAGVAVAFEVFTCEQSYVAAKLPLAQKITSQRKSK